MPDWCTVRAMFDSSKNKALPNNCILYHNKIRF